jgi:hypothetical protein
MVRFWVIGIVIAVALSIFTFVDIALTEGRRVRGVPKGFWFFIALLPILGAVLWFLVGKEPASAAPRQVAPDDDPSFLRDLRRDDEQDERIRRLEQELADLDADDDDTNSSDSSRR